jgi:hypothetical protein
VHAATALVWLPHLLLPSFTSASFMQLQAAAQSSSDAGKASSDSAAGAAGTSSSQPAAGDGASGTAMSRQKRRQQWARWKPESDTKEATLKQAGLWLPSDVYKSLSHQEQQRITQMQTQYRQQLQLHKPLRSLHMSAVALNPHQLQVMVALATDAAAGNDSSSSSSSSMQEADPGVAAAAAAADTGIDAGQSQASSSSNSSRSSMQPRKQRRLQQLQQQEQQLQAANTRSRGNPFGFQFLTQPQLDKKSCLQTPSEQSLVINLNSQMRLASAKEDFARVVSLFDQFLAKGIAAAEEAAAAASEQQHDQQGVQQQQQQQQHEDGQQQQPQQAGSQQQQRQQRVEQLVLPREYCLDHNSLTMYCRALVE